MSIRKKPRFKNETAEAYFNMLSDKSNVCESGIDDSGKIYIAWMNGQIDRYTRPAFIKKAEDWRESVELTIDEIEGRYGKYNDGNDDLLMDEYFLALEQKYIYLEENKDMKPNKYSYSQDIDGFYSIYELNGNGIVTEKYKGMTEKDAKEKVYKLNGWEYKNK